MVCVARERMDRLLSSCKPCRAERERSRAEIKAPCLHRRQASLADAASPTQLFPQPGGSRSKKGTRWELLAKTVPKAPEIFSLLYPQRPCSARAAEPSSPGAGVAAPCPASVCLPPALPDTLLPSLTRADVLQLLLAPAPQVLPDKP